MLAYTTATPVPAQCTTCGVVIPPGCLRHIIFEPWERPGHGRIVCGLCRMAAEIEEAGLCVLAADTEPPIPTDDDWREVMAGAATWQRN